MRKSGELLKCLFSTESACTDSVEIVAEIGAAFLLERRVFAVTGGTYPLRDSPAGHGPQFISSYIFDVVW